MLTRVRTWPIMPYRATAATAARPMDTTRYIFFPVATYSMMTNTLNSTSARPRSFSSTTTTKASAHMIMSGKSVGRLGR